MLRKYLPHCAIILSVMYFVFFFIDKVNAPMNFINNGITKGILFVLGVISIVNALYVIRIDRQKLREQTEWQRWTSAGQRRPASRPDSLRQPPARSAGQRRERNDRRPAGSQYNRPAHRQENPSRNRYDSYQSPRPRQRNDL